jgi:hypothetical protein
MGGSRSPIQPGALLAQQLRRHKCAKPGLLAVFWCTLAINGMAFLVGHSVLLHTLQACRRDHAPRDRWRDGFKTILSISHSITETLSGNHPVRAS